MALVGLAEQLCEKILIPVSLDTLDAHEIIPAMNHVMNLPPVTPVLSFEACVRFRSWTERNLVLPGPQREAVLHSRVAGDRSVAPRKVASRQQPLVAPHRRISSSEGKNSVMLLADSISEDLGSLRLKVFQNSPGGFAY